ncbi:AAA family ATPase [Bifidobacterium crudilactis]|uniref:AAA family ATPase n=1 Tax=Bifidobacterium crudilactis TaxID=327277 RepID=UPI0026496FFA|nr:AAA family ATPase [Bifidobacterium crudilactis]MDN5973449.1 AAA family ATPase [Bifidobacterium crudilactis]MDN6001790.1 AAA family ATPase [Bifidobacterium crudilactis]MDN6271578.1 AAA family ATPase [Bifidobacterium crudilactis]MDN6458402.1 AAA family ATPase [Bifidobacterium crudilactis]MDN6468235.1 AAA family ATPase [Bifidobacterium crudilactis]
MRITELRAENVKRLKAVDITPGEHLQIIGGRNAQGKSSVLDAVALALTGKDAKKLNPRPLRDGEKKGKVQLDLGEYVVTRTFTANGGGALTVTAGRSGARFPSPQRVLDDLMGRLSFDPQEFIGLSGREQAEVLRGLVDLPIDLDEVDAQLDELAQSRLLAGRELKALGEPGRVDDSLPSSERSATVIVNLIQTARDRNREIENARREHADAGDRIVDLAHQIQQLQHELETERADQKRLKERIDFLGEPKDTTELESQLANIEDTNARVRANRQVVERNADITSRQRTYEGLDQRINDLRASKDKALAEAKFPIDGLGFDESGVTYKGVPFQQASSMEQLRVSLAIAMASNPKLRVIRIKDGSLLDDDALALVAQTAEQHNYQVLMERVGTGDPGAIIIEDGQVKEATK